jgi:hypothetical protein
MPRQPKSRSKVIVDEAYLQHLVAESVFIEEMFEDLDHAVLTPETFRRLKKLHAAGRKIPAEACEPEPYKD